MARSLVRRPLPALIALFALLLMTALVWWRVLHRDSSNAGAHPTCTSPTPTAPATKTLPAPASVTVEVLNGTYKLKKPRSGIAGKVATKLGKAGFNVPDAATDDKQNKVRSVAEIRFGPKGKSAATLLDYYFDQKAHLVPVPKEKSANVTVSLGRKYKALTKKAAVRKALAADHITLASPKPSHTPSGGASCASSAA
jgi:hypothetical protein